MHARLGSSRIFRVYAPSAIGGKAWGALLLVAVVGVGLRVLFGVVGVEPRPGVFGGAPTELSHDALFFEEYADHLRHGEGYSSGDPPRPEASHPPVFPIALAALSTVGLDTFDAHRVALAVLGGIGVVLVGLVGRRLAGPAVGLIAACIAALHPLWVQPAGVIMSALSAPSIGRFIALGALIGVATLTRSEALLLVVFVGAPTVILARVRRVVYGVVLIAGRLAIAEPTLVLLAATAIVWGMSRLRGRARVSACA